MTRMERINILTAELRDLHGDEQAETDRRMAEHFGVKVEDLDEYDSGSVTSIRDLADAQHGKSGENGDGQSRSAHVPHRFTIRSSGGFWLEDDYGDDSDTVQASMSTRWRPPSDHQDYLVQRISRQLRTTRDRRCLERWVRGQPLRRMRVTTTVAEQEDRQVMRPLRVLVPLIKEDLKHGDEAAQSAGLPYYRAAGEKMIEAKGQLEHGQFGPWIKRNFKIGSNQASRYMSLARTTTGKQISRGRYTSLSDHVRSVGRSPRGSERGGASWQEPIRELIDKAQANADRLAQENLNRADEREAQRKLAIQLIDIGFKALAAKFHPDKRGGSRDAMTRLNLVRARLKASA